MNGFKVRLGDGSEIGPMDADAMRTWIAQGLVDQESQVLPPGSRKWVPLGSVRELTTLVEKSRTARESGGRGPARRGDRGPGFSLDGRLDHWRIIAIGAVLIGIGGVAAVPAFRPDEAVAGLEGTPWLQVALGCLGGGLALLPGWNLTRRLVRVVLFLAGFALFAVAGILIAQGERGATLVALASVWLLASGLLALLAPSLHWRGLLLGVVCTALGATGAIRYGRATDGADARRVREWSSPERRFTDDALGLTLELPAGWVALKPANPMVPAATDAWLTLAQPRQGAFALVLTGRAPIGVATPEQYMERVIARRSTEHPGYAAGPHANALLGAVTGRRATASWADAGVRQNELIVAGIDGWMGFALVAWMPQASGERGTETLERLAGALAARGLLAARLREAVQTAVSEVPHLTAASAEQLMASSEARVLEPEQAFRRSVAALAKQIPSLSKAESRELSELTTAAYAGLPWAERNRLSTYIDRVRNGETTPPDEDREMARLTKAAEGRLTQARLMRLRVFYDKAVVQD